MISNDSVKQLARTYQTNELNIRREYYQHLFLSYFYRQAGAQHLYFKGGTALRIIYQSPRFSEDLDFDSSIHDVSTIEHILIATLAEIEREGIQAEITESKKTTGGYLAALLFVGDEYRVLLQIEISLRAGQKSGTVTSIFSDFVPAYSLVQLEPGLLIRGKIAALLDRKKPRDFYDLYFILRANLLPVETREILVKVITILQSTSINFEKELKEFLPKSHWALIRDFPDALRREIQKFV
ncbi:MAG: hypothetical protein A3C02_04190 [Candidatus Andersenbacteria bacterium RIFCSPHIGHO2_02_FULL_45_11]|nr:MAG: hypothetical protein A3C02_04190 [Candidatus Andersenbacteria bacterium RIFCSPHIGHO2_02_FULL_45_11]